MQDKVFKMAGTFCATENQQKEAEVGHKEQDLNRDCEQQKRCGIGRLFFLLAAIGEDAHNHVQATVTALHEENEADNGEVRTE